MTEKFIAIISKPLHQEAFFVFLGQFASAIGMLVGVKALTSCLQPEAYGMVALGMSVANLSIYLLGTPVGFAATRFYRIALEGGNLAEYESMLWVIGWRTATIFFVLAVGLLLAANLFYCLVAILSLMLCVDTVFNGIQTGARNRRTVAFLQSLLTWSRFIFAVGLVLLSDRESVQLVFSGFCLSTLLSIGLQLYFYHRKIRTAQILVAKTGGAFEKKQFQAYLRPLVITGAFSWGQLFIDRWSLIAFTSVDEVGIYFALYQISYAPVLLLNSCVYYFISPILFEKAGNTKDAARMKSIYSHNEVFSALILLLSVVLAGSMGMLHGWLGQLLLGTNYRDYTSLLPWLVLSGGIYATGTQLLLSIQSGLNLKPLLVQKTVSSGVALLCYVLGVYWFGLRGVVFGGLIFAVFYATMAFFFHRQLFKK